MNSSGRDARRLQAGAGQNAVAGQQQRRAAPRRVGGEREEEEEEARRVSIVWKSLQRRDENVERKEKWSSTEE